MLSGGGSTSSGCVFDFAGNEREVEDLEIASAQDGFWSNADAAQQVMRRIGELRANVEQWRQVNARLDDAEELNALDDAELSGGIAQELASVRTSVEGIELDAALNGPYDRSDAIMMVHAGEGGVDSQDFAQMLVRMYVRWAEQRGLKADILDITDGDEAGIKNATIEMKGTNAYGYANAESGSHRLVRLSPFDAAHRRHTSFALVEVLPEIETDNQVDLNPDDVRVDTYRASGAGGQHVNKTSSAIRLTHAPSGIVVTCQNERSQTQNRESAFKILRSRLLQRKLAEEADERNRLRGEYTAAGFGNRIRSYVLHPYTMVTDHRTDHSVSDAQGVLNGDVQPFIDAMLKSRIGAVEPA